MKTKTILSLFLLAVSIGAARAQDATPAITQPADYQQLNYQPAADEPPAVYLPPPPAVVYQAPVVYAAPVVYQAPVVYYAPVYYGVPPTPPICAPSVGCAEQNDTARSTVTYIGGGQVGYQVAPRCNPGSTLVFIGGHSR